MTIMVYIPSTHYSRNPLLVVIMLVLLSNHLVAMEQNPRSITVVRKNSYGVKSSSPLSRNSSSRAESPRSKEGSPRLKQSSPRSNSNSPGSSPRSNESSPRASEITQSICELCIEYTQQYDCHGISHVVIHFTNINKYMYLSWHYDSETKQSCDITWGNDKKSLFAYHLFEKKFNEQQAEKVMKEKARTLLKAQWQEQQNQLRDLAQKTPMIKEK